jgi:hypothetical protein
MKANKYRTRVLEIEALQVHLGETLIDEIREFVGDSLKITPEDAYIKTLEGDMLITDGCYIVKGTHNEFYPVKREIFEHKYELVED